jgi:hypothetical protein
VASVYNTKDYNIQCEDWVEYLHRSSGLALQVRGVSRIGAIKYGLESHGTVLARTSSNSKLQTHPLVKEGATK